MKLLRLAGTMALAFTLLLLWAGCGSTYRPVVNTILPPSPNPQTQTFGLVLNQDATSGSAALAETDITGDTAFWNQQVGSGPVSVGVLGLQAFVANQGSGTVSAFALGTSQPVLNTIPVGSKPTAVLPIVSSSSTSGALTAVKVAAGNGGSGYTVGQLLTVTPQTGGGSGGVVRVESTDTSQNNLSGIGQVLTVSIVAGGSGYTVQTGVATTTTGGGSGAVIDITAVGGTGSVYVANFGDNTVTAIDASQYPPLPVATIPLTGGTGPIAMAASNDGSRVYVANRDSANVSVIATSGTTANTVINTISLPGTQPVAVVTNTDSGLVYVYSANDGKIYVINPNSSPTPDALVATVTATALAGGPCLVIAAPAAPCQPMAFDSHSQRLYVADGNSTVSIFNTSTSTPTQLPSITGLSNPTMVTPLPDGSRAYVVNTGTSSTTAGLVSVINVATGQVTKTVSVGATPVAIAAAIDSTRVLVAHQGEGVNSSGVLQSTLPAGTTIITTANDTVVTDLAAPPLDPNCPSNCPVMTPVFVATSH